MFAIAYYGAERKRLLPRKIQCSVSEVSTRSVVVKNGTKEHSVAVWRHGGEPADERTKIGFSGIYPMEIDAE